ncbi:Arm DNA-binding domain-containing protein [Vibrio nomapromontoriensis]|uniref:Arm DNA-binding domain-containing protein n=1 Tax=Vibrio nomapromontoriensis TaxID=2910246 RepID=UPI003D13EAD8
MVGYGEVDVRKVEALIKTGGKKTQRYTDGEGLYLVVQASGSASWMLRFTCF